jgi:hypothetical protein
LRAGLRAALIGYRVDGWVGFGFVGGLWRGVDGVCKVDLSAVSSELFMKRITVVDVQIGSSAKTFEVL